MDSAWIAMVMGILILVASMASVELGISVALIEIILGVVASNGLASTCSSGPPGGWSRSSWFPPG